MGTKVGLTGITFGDATVQNTAAVTGVTSLTAGSGISLSGSTGAVTVTNSAQGTSYSAGNGLSLSSTTFSVAAPSHNSVGSYVFAGYQSAGNGSNPPSTGSNYSAGTGSGQIGSNGMGFNPNDNSLNAVSNTNNLSGTWKWLGTSTLGGGSWVMIALAVRVS
jgi:hypothetical protein